jgi:hypothetical protein
MAICAVERPFSRSLTLSTRLSGGICHGRDKGCAGEAVQPSHGGHRKMHSHHVMRTGGEGGAGGAGGARGMAPFADVLAAAGLLGDCRRRRPATSSSAHAQQEQQGASCACIGTLLCLYGLCRPVSAPAAAETSCTARTSAAAPAEAPMAAARPKLGSSGLA